jgi:MFS family permease
MATLAEPMTGTRQHYGLTLAILTLATTAYALQQTMVVPALPQLQRELDASTTWVTWVLTGFLLSAAVLTPILGKLGDRFGKERLLVAALGTFLVGCVGCALAPDIWTLIAARVVSGAGGAVFPLSFGIIRDEFPPERVKIGIGLLSAVFGVGGGLGLVLSGVIVDNASWRWIFVVGAAAGFCSGCPRARAGAGRRPRCSASSASPPPWARRGSCSSSMRTSRSSTCACSPTGPSS